MTFGGRTFRHGLELTIKDLIIILAIANITGISSDNQLRSYFTCSNDDSFCSNELSDIICLYLVDGFYWDFSVGTVYNRDIEVLMDSERNFFIYSSQSVYIRVKIENSLLLKMTRILFLNFLILKL